MSSSKGSDKGKVLSINSAKAEEVVYSMGKNRLNSYMAPVISESKHETGLEYEETSGMSIAMKYEDEDDQMWTTLTNFLHVFKESLSLIWR